MTRRVLTVALLGLAANLAAAGDSYSSLAGAKGTESAVAVPVANASRRSIAADKAQAISAEQLRDMLGFGKSSSNKSIAGKESVSLTMEAASAACDAVGFMLSEVVKARETKDSPELSALEAKLLRDERSYNLLLLSYHSSMQKIVIPARTDALAELKKLNAVLADLHAQSLELAKQGSYIATYAKIKDLQKKIKDAESRQYFLQLVTRD